MPPRAVAPAEVRAGPRQLPERTNLRAVIEKKLNNALSTPPEIVQEGLIKSSASASATSSASASALMPQMKTRSMVGGIIINQGVESIIESMKKKIDAITIMEKELNLSSIISESNPVLNIELVEKEIKLLTNMKMERKQSKIFPDVISTIADIPTPTPNTDPFSDGGMAGTIQRFQYLGYNNNTEDVDIVDNVDKLIAKLSKEKHINIDDPKTYPRRAGWYPWQEDARRVRTGVQGTKGGMNKSLTKQLTNIDENLSQYLKSKLKISSKKVI